MAASNEFESQWLECQQKYGRGIDAGGIDEITDADEIAEQVTLPGVEVDQNGAFTRYVYAKFSVFKQAAQRAATAIQNTWNLWFGADATSGVQKQWADLSADAVAKTNAANTAAGYANTQGDYAKAKGDEVSEAILDITTQKEAAIAAANNANDKAALANTAATNANNAATNANAKATLANDAATNANNKASLADTAATNANNKASLADTAATNANNKASLADTAATNANNAAGSVNTAISNAEAATAEARTQAGRAEDAADEWTNTYKPQATADHNQAVTDHNTAVGDSSTAGDDHDRAVSDHNTADDDHTQAVTDHNTAAGDHTQAGLDHTASVTATNEASNVNAQLSGMTVTITNRQGTSTSVNIGFEIYNTYASVAAMNADAANVPTGKFVMIATTDPTSAENARLYGKNAQGSFTFLSDLDQASSAAWADWLNNQKPLIENATNAASTAATNATNQGNTAEQKGNTAQSQGNAAESAMNSIVTQWQGSDGNGGIKKDMNDTRTAVAAQGNTAESQGNTAEQKGNTAKTQGDYAKSQGDYAKDKGDHTDEIRNDGYVYSYDPENPQAGADGYYKTNRHVVAEIDASTLTAEQIQAAVAGFVFATVEEGQAAIAEL